MAKYRLTRETLQADPAVCDMLDIREVSARPGMHGVHCPGLHFTPHSPHDTCMQAPQATAEELARAHDPGYVARVFAGELSEKEMRSIGFPWSQGLVGRSRASAGGTLAATRALLEWHLPFAANIAGALAAQSPMHLCLGTSSSMPGMATYEACGACSAVHDVASAAAGGTHHAFRDRGEGFCVFCDIAVAACAAMEEEGVERVLVIDLDVHQAWDGYGMLTRAPLVSAQPSRGSSVRMQGNGTSAIFADDSRVTTFDVHGERCACRGGAPRQRMVASMPTRDPPGSCTQARRTTHGRRARSPPMTSSCRTPLRMPTT